MVTISIMVAISIERLIGPRCLGFLSRLDRPVDHDRLIDQEGKTAWFFAMADWRATVAVKTSRLTRLSVAHRISFQKGKAGSNNSIRDASIKAAELCEAEFAF